MRILTELRLIGFFTTMLSGASLVAAATVCVDPDEVSCSPTIQAGVDAAVAGDTVSIASGVYFESVLIPAGKDGLVLVGGTIDPHAVPYDPNAPFDPNEPFGTNEPAAIRVESNGVRIEGVRVQNGIGNSIEAVANGLTLNKVVVRGPDGHCIRVLGNDAVVTGSVLRGCGSTNIDIEGDRAQLLKNKVSLCDNDCINVDGDDAVIEGNLVSQAEDGTSVRVNGDRLAFRKNKVSNGDDDGLRLNGDDAVIESNKFTGIDDSAIEFNGDNPTIRKNSVSTVTSQGIYINCEPCTGGLVAKNKVVAVSGDAECFRIDADGRDPNDPNSPSIPPTSPFVVEGNVGSQCSDAAFDISGNGVTVRKNTAKDNGGDEGEEGFDIRGVGHIVEGNSSTGNFSSGYTIAGTGHILRNNKATANLGDGFQIEGEGLLTFSQDGGHTFVDNKSNDNLGQGFAVLANDPNDPPLASALTGNSASGNRTDFCAAAAANPVLSNNDFDTTANTCLNFD